MLTPGKAASLEVTVLDVDRSAAANAQVRLECLVDGHSIGAYRGVTNEQGRVTLENIQPNDDIDFELNGHILDESEKLVAYARVTVSSLQSPATLQLEAVGN